MPRRLLLLAATTGYQTRVFADAARRLGYELVLATDRCHVLDDPWGDQAIPIRFEDTAASLDAIAAAGLFDGIIAVGDRPTHLAALAAERLGLPYNSPASAAACRNKYLARQLYQAAGLPVPSYFRVQVDESPSDAARRADYPCVLKPLGLSASRGVIRANDQSQFVDAFRRIAALLASPEILMQEEAHNRYIQVERFIEGREYAIEGVLNRGRLQLLALFDKPDPLDGPFFEETLYVTPSRAPAETQAALLEATERGIRALGLTHGPVHAELRYNDAGPWILEIAARPIGGLCAQALRFKDDLRFTGGIPLEELLLRHAAGEDVAAATLDGPASGVMMIPIPRSGIYEDVEGVERASAVAGIEDIAITAKQGQKLTPLPEGASYLGFIFARAESAETVENALRAAHAELRFRITTALPILTPS